MSKKITTEEYINVCNKIHNFKYTYDKTVYKDAKNGKSHPYLTTDHTGRLEGCTREYTTFESAKKSYDEKYLVEKRRIYNLGNGKRCAYIATYKWAPKNLQVVYPTVTSPYSYNALAQICNGEDAPRYK